MPIQHLVVMQRDYKQKVIVILEKGEQISTILDCIIRVEQNPKPNSILFPRTAHYKGKPCRLIKYSEKQDILFYKLVQ